MRIHERITPITIKYKALATGDIIKDDGKIYKKTREGKVQGCGTDLIFTYNAICLDDGTNAYFDKELDVVPITNYSFEYSI